MQWPLYFRETTEVRNPQSNVALCTLWTETEKITKNIKNDFAIAGNLYFNDGINYMVRNILSNPNIRYIVLCGADLSKSGEHLIDFFNGKDIVEEEIKPYADLIRKNVSVIDMRGSDSEEIDRKISSLKRLQPFSEPIILKASEPKCEDAFPSHSSGFVVRGSIGDAWLSILRNIMHFGATKKTEYGGEQKELLNLMAVVEEEGKHEPYFAFSEADLEDYYPQVMSANKIEGTSYTYGQRFRNHEGYDQIKKMIEDLKKTNYTRRAMAVTWNVKEDFHSEHPPCWILLQGLAQEGKLFLTSYIRSNDMFGAWPQNAFALKKIQKEIADGIGLQTGSLTTISSSAHIYDRNWEKARKILEEYDKPQDLMLDPKGNFLVQIENKEIIVTHYSPDGSKLQIYRGKTAEEIYRHLAKNEAISMSEHWAYIGEELAKAEIAINNNLPYVQDRELKI